MRHFFLLTTVLLFIMAGCSSERGIDPATEAVPAALEKRNVPIGGSLNGTVSPSVISPGIFRWEVAAQGNISHLGRVNAAIIFPEVEVDIHNQTMIVRSGTWTGVMTAANGDRLFGLYTVRNGSTTFDALGNIGFVADLEITGGTGRFQGATGLGVANGQGNIFTLSFGTSVQGTISQVGN